MEGIGSLEICPSCGMQFGYADAAGGDSLHRERLHMAWRAKWLEVGQRQLTTDEQKEVITSALQ